MQKIVYELIRYTSFLNSGPTASEILLSLVRDFLTPFKVSGIQICTLNSGDKLKAILGAGQNVFLNNKPISDYSTTEITKDFSVEHFHKALSDKPLLTSPEQCLCLAPLNVGLSTVGLFCYKHSDFDWADEENTYLLRAFSNITSQYLTGEKYFVRSGTSRGTDLETHDVTALTNRQREILTHIVDGKTNHQIASLLGFSNSTIRHETMNIFKTLGVSDRKEAAKLATAQTLI